MSEFHVPGRFNPRLISEELVEAFPQLIVQVDDEKQALFTLSFDGATLHFRSVQTIRVQDFLAVLNAHNPDAKSKNERRKERAEALKASIRGKLREFTDEELGFLLEFLQEFAEESRIQRGIS